MPDDIPPFSERAFRLNAEAKIRAAIKEGEFDNLPGFGTPSPVIDEAYDPYWWIRRKLAREDVKLEAPLE